MFKPVERGRPVRASRPQILMQTIDDAVTRGKASKCPSNVQNNDRSRVNGNLALPQWCKEKKTGITSLFDRSIYLQSGNNLYYHNQQNNIV